MILRMEVPHIHLHRIVFFKSYQVLLTAGFENKISVLSIHSSQNDFTLSGELIGHLELVTSI